MKMMIINSFTIISNDKQVVRLLLANIRTAILQHIGPLLNYFIFIYFYKKINLQQKLL